MVAYFKYQHGAFGRGDWRMRKVFVSILVALIMTPAAGKAACSRAGELACVSAFPVSFGEAVAGIRHRFRDQGHCEAAAHHVGELSRFGVPGSKHMTTYCGECACRAAFGGTAHAESLRPEDVRQTLQTDPCDGDRGSGATCAAPKL
jgi:hypothetical protein